MENTVVTLATRKCFHCGQTGQVEVLAADLARYERGELVQRAFPEMPKELREQIVSGTHPKCWEAMFAYDEDDLDDEDAPEDSDSVESR